MDTLEQSKQTKSSATKILDQTDLVRRLSKYGDVRIGGSYFTDLMSDADIDVSVAAKDPRGAALGFLNDIINDRVCEKYQYGDFEKFPRENRPKDHIVVLILQYDKRRWEIEVWFSKEHDKEQLSLEERLNSLPSETKRQIIERKCARAKSGQSKHELSSFDIYKDYIHG